MYRSRSIVVAIAEIVHIGWVGVEGNADDQMPPRRTYRAASGAITFVRPHETGRQRNLQTLAHRYGDQ